MPRVADGSSGGFHMRRFCTIRKPFLLIIPLFLLAGCSAGLHVISQKTNVYLVKVLYDSGFSGDRKKFFYQEVRNFCREMHGNEMYRIIVGPSVYGYRGPQNEINNDTRNVYVKIECEMINKQESPNS